MIETQRGDRWAYRCEQCGSEFVYTIRKSKPPKCGHGGKVCKYRGDVVATITGRVAGCKCSTAAIEVYKCRHFREPVIKYGNPPCLDTLREQVPGATGRTCHGCEVQALSSAETAKP